MLFITGIGKILVFRGRLSPLHPRVILVHLQPFEGGLLTPFEDVLHSQTNCLDHQGVTVQAVRHGLSTMEPFLSVKLFY